MYKPVIDGHLRRRKMVLYGPYEEIPSPQSAHQDALQSLHNNYLLLCLEISNQLCGSDTFRTFFFFWLIIWICFVEGWKKQRRGEKKEEKAFDSVTKNSDGCHLFRRFSKGCWVPGNSRFFLLLLEQASSHLVVQCIYLCSSNSNILLLLSTNWLKIDEKKSPSVNRKHLCSAGFVDVELNGTIVFKCYKLNRFSSKTLFI